jgi:hypothetical protein
MEHLTIPKDYESPLTIRETEVAIKEIKDHFERALAKSLHLTRVSAPLFVKPESGLNDNLNGVERPVSFGIKEQNDNPVEIVHSLAKWKRYALKRYGFHSGEGLYTDMKGILGVKGIFPGFHCVFCSDPLPYVGEEWQTLETLWSYLQKAKILITMTKPIRITPFLFYQRFCYVGGDDSHEDLCGIDKSKGYSTPFGWGIGMKYTDENWWLTSKEQSTEYPKSYVDWEPYYDPDDDGVGHWDPPDGADLRYTDDPNRRYTDLSGIVNEISKKTPEELISLYPVAHIEGEDLVKDLPWGFKQWRWVRMDPAVTGYEYAPYMLRIIFVLRIWKEQLRNEPDFAKDITQMRDDIWPQITIPSTMQDVPDVAFTPLAQPLQATSDFYFLQLEIRLPISQECTWADDNKWHDWWDWRNLDRPVSPEDVPEWWDDWRKQWEEIPNYNVYSS